tara:strand:+ start:9859 stop:10530 length:672 start_codon:yes stop_codon:yes gene_type:complete
MKAKFEFPGNDRAFQVIKFAIAGHPRIAKNPNSDAFAREIADLLVKFIELRNSSKEEADYVYPRGWEQRTRVASQAILDLARTLETMHPGELKRWLPPSTILAKWAGTEPDITIFENGLEIEGGTPVPEDKYYESVERWVSIIIEMAQVVDLRKNLDSPGHTSRPDQIRFRVKLIAKAWISHFGTPPKTSSNSAFPSVVRQFYKFLGDKPPSHSNIGAALKLE